MQRPLKRCSLRNSGGSKIRVLYVIMNLDFGGTASVMLETVKKINLELFELGILILNSKNNSPVLYQMLQETGNRIFELNQSKKYGFRAIYQHISSFRPHILHVQDSLSLLKVLFPSMVCRIPVKVKTIHCDSRLDASVLSRALHQFKWFRVFRHLYACYDAVFRNVVRENREEKDIAVGLLILKIAYRLSSCRPVAISKSVRQSMISVYRNLSSIPVIYNGVDTNRFHLPKPMRTGEQNKIKLIHISRLSAEKNQVLLLKAFALALKRCGGLLLTIVGSGPELKRLVKLAHALGVAENTDFLGNRADVPDLLSNHDIFILTSETEGFGLVLMEAMAAGLPVISTAVGGVPEIVRNGANGTLVQPGDTVALAGEICRYAEDEKLRKSIGSWNARYALTYDIHRTVARYMEVYRKLLIKKRRWKE